MKTVYVHAGMHKTGSTSIQKYVEEHCDFFRANGFEIVEDMRFDSLGQSRPTGTNCFRIAHVLIDSRLETPVRLKGRVKPMTLPQKVSAVCRANARLRGSSLDKIMLSAEAFSFLRSRSERFWFKLMFAGLAVKPILFFRDKADWLKSWKTQLELNRVPYNRDDSRPTGIFDVSDRSWLVDHQRIASFFGPRGTYLSYEDAMSEYRSVIPAFLVSSSNRRCR